MPVRTSRKTRSTRSCWSACKSPIDVTIHQCLNFKIYFRDLKVHEEKMAKVDPMVKTAMLVMEEIQAHQAKTEYLVQKVTMATTVLEDDPDQAVPKVHQVRLDREETLVRLEEMENLAVPVVQVKKVRVELPVNQDQKVRLVLLVNQAIRARMLHIAPVREETLLKMLRWLSVPCFLNFISHF